MNRLQKELCDLMMQPDDNISAFPLGDNIFKWQGTINGAEETPYENCKFKLSMEFPREYPHHAPKIKFTTKCYHPNIDYKTGDICLDILKEEWSSSYTIKSILISILSLLNDPNNDSPLNEEAAELWEKDINEFKEKIKLLNIGSKK